MDVTTKIRCAASTPPNCMRCDDERVKALAARDELARILVEGGVGVSGVGPDKYGYRGTRVSCLAE
jgi:hypothetical protein